MTKRLGITGGIGSGKSHVARLLTEQYGGPVYDTDSRAKALMATSTTIREGLTALLGEGYDKKTIADFLFASPENAAKVNAIVHPAVKDDYLRWVAEQTADVVAVESAILIEAGFDTLVDCVVVVTAPREIRIQRAMRRDGSTRADVERRMALQMSDEERALHADVLVVNDGRELNLSSLL